MAKKAVTRKPTMEEKRRLKWLLEFLNAGDLNRLPYADLLKLKKEATAFYHLGDPDAFEPSVRYYLLGL